MHSNVMDCDNKYIDQASTSMRTPFGESFAHLRSEMGEKFNGFQRILDDIESLSSDTSPIIN